MYLKMVLPNMQSLWSNRKACYCVKISRLRMYWLKNSIEILCFCKSQLRHKILFFMNQQEKQPHYRTTSTVV